MISCYFGLPGCGKSSFLAMLAKRAHKKIIHDLVLSANASCNGNTVSRRRLKSKYHYVLSNFSMSGCFKFNYASDFGRYDYSYSLQLLDELTLFSDSRSYKNFDQDKKEGYIMHRHSHIDIAYATQQFDGVDKKIRDLTYDLFYIRKFLWWSYGTRIFRTIEIQEGEIINGYRFPNIIERILARLFPYLFKIRVWCFRPFYYDMYDSWEMKDLPKPKLVPW